VRPSVVTPAAAVLAVATWAAGEQPKPVDVPGLLARVGERVEAYFARAQRIICLETVHLQPLRPDFLFDGTARRLVYDLRVSWEPAIDVRSTPEATVLRQLRTVNGRPPAPADENACMDPKGVSPDPLAFLLAHKQAEFDFEFKGGGRTDGRAAVMLDYKPIGSPPPEVVWRDNCVDISIPARTTGRIWIDTATGDVLRLYERIAGPFDVPMPRGRRYLRADAMVVDRAETTIRYKPVAFRDPDETVLLPESIESVSVIRGAGVPRLRTTQTFSEYRRFVTDARIVP
jgi:hypothetical protein